MQRLAVIGAGDLGAGIVRRAAERGLAREIVLLDPAAGDLARGKALDLLQSGPVVGCDVRITGAAEWDALSGCDAIVVAEPAGEPDERATVTAVQRAGDLAGAALVVIAVADAVAAMGAARGANLRRERVLGSAPMAVQGALRHHLAHELGCDVRDVQASVLGRPPAGYVVPRSAATAGGVPVDALSAVALRRATAAALHPPGPVALAAAAVELLAAATRPRPSLRPVLVRLEGEYGQRGAVAAVPARVGGGGLREVVEIALEPVERIALDNAVQDRRPR